MSSAQAVQSGATVGPLLQYWRKTRQLSQLGLAHEAGVSPRHVCFLETGRAKPSREMVILLATVLEVPLRERNALLLAAGFAPIYSEASLDAPELAAVRTALDAVLAQQEPFPSVVMNRGWDILESNGAAQRFFGLMLAERSPGPANVLRLMFDPKGLRPFVKGWEAVASALLGRVQREAVSGIRGEATSRLLDELLSQPDVPRHLRKLSLDAPLVPVIPIQFDTPRGLFNYFSMVTTVGTPQDITLQEVRIESFFPADRDTASRARRLADAT